MKHLKNINERAAKYDNNQGEFMFDPAEYDNTVTFYLHDDKNKTGFVLNISPDDRSQMEKLLNKNKVKYTVEAGNVLPF